MAAESLEAALCRFEEGRTVALDVRTGPASLLSFDAHAPSCSSCSRTAAGQPGPDRAPTVSVLPSRCPSGRRGTIGSPSSRSSPSRKKNRFGSERVGVRPKARRQPLVISGECHRRGQARAEAEARAPGSPRSSAGPGCRVPQPGPTLSAMTVPEKCAEGIEDRAPTATR
ncbi:hypothetical protein GCM10010294_48500 [Streptomyces griseoloalbus]|nr:hypothetical protein GCM10010294_48500 [Streptomyces griseoloalbus]